MDEKGVRVMVEINEGPSFWVVSMSFLRPRIKVLRIYEPLYFSCMSANYCYVPTVWMFALNKKISFNLPPRASTCSCHFFLSFQVFLCVEKNGRKSIDQHSTIDSEQNTKNYTETIIISTVWISPPFSPIIATGIQSRYWKFQSDLVGNRVLDCIWRRRLDTN